MNEEVNLMNNQNTKFKKPPCTGSIGYPCYAKLREIVHLRKSLCLPMDYTDDQVLLFKDTLSGSIVLCNLAFSNLWREIKHEMLRLGDKINKRTRSL